MGDKISVAQGPTHEADEPRDDGFVKPDQVDDEVREATEREVDASGTANVKPDDAAGDDYDTRDKTSLATELADRGHQPSSRATRDDMIAQLRQLDAERG